MADMSVHNTMISDFDALVGDVLRVLYFEFCDCCVYCNYSPKLLIYELQSTLYLKSKPLRCLFSSVAALNQQSTSVISVEDKASACV